MATVIYVSPQGSDTHSGSEAQPLRSLAAAQAAARNARLESPSSPVNVLLMEGVYYLPQPLVFTAEDSGTESSPVTYAALPDAEVVLSGGMRLDLAWTDYTSGILKAALPQGVTTDQLFVNGERQILARYPNFDPGTRIFNGTASDAASPERARRWADPRGGYIHAMHEYMWGDMAYRITGKDAVGNLTWEGGWQNNRPAAMHPQYRYIENIFEELDAPGEWFCDAKAATLYYYPIPGLDLADAVVEGVRLKHLIEFQGTDRRPVRHIKVRGITFRHAQRTFMDNDEPILRSDWTIYRGGAVLFQGAEDCGIADCFLDQVGGNAVFVDGYNRRVTVQGCRIFQAGASGVAFVGDPSAVRNGIPWGRRNHAGAIDRTLGPQSDHYPADCLVDDCLIHETGRFEKQSAGVEIDIAQDITVRHCSIYGVPRAGVNIGDGAFGGHVVEDCDVFDTVLETGDHGAFNSWGRDRFWDIEGVDLGTVTLGADKAIPLLDAVKPVTLRRNRWRCDHGWDIDLDDGSSHYVIRDNLCLNGGIKNREGFYRVVENNIIVANSFHPHVWYANSQDVFRRNIVSRPYEPIGMAAPWGREIDHNLLAEPGAPIHPAAALQEQSGGDEHSLAADPQFIDPARGDYRVRETSPALTLGFVNFRMDGFGVRTPRLRAIAASPKLSETRDAPVPSLRDPATIPWLGARIKNVTGLGEVSAGGLAGEIGIWIEQVAPGTAAAQYDLQATDVIQKANGRPTDSLADFAEVWNALPTGSKVALLIRHRQKAIVVDVETDGEDIPQSARERVQQRPYVMIPHQAS